jgi:hypothetical protein
MFNEMSPLSSDTEYLKGSSKSVIDAMTAADPKAVWLMQGWVSNFTTKKRKIDLFKSSSLFLSIVVLC